MGSDIDDPPCCFQSANYELSSLLVFSSGFSGIIMIQSYIKRLNLTGLTEKFETERITLDLVYKLSVHEMEILGVNFRRDMISLRIECTKF